MLFLEDLGALRTVYIQSQQFHLPPDLFLLRLQPLILFLDPGELLLRHQALLDQLPVSGQQ